ncbi:MAG: hypothetical protein CMM55_10965 [Rhodospirillaceae bacterium]|nr:hypothetical protein [Rhodospirillaceae bacterium]
MYACLLRTATDVLLGLGFTDDAAIFLAARKAVISPITDNHRIQADDTFEQRKTETEEYSSRAA